MASTSNRADKEASGLRARIKDAARLSGVRRRPCYIGFLDDGERAEAEVILRGGAYASYGRRFYGGYEEAERVMLGLSAEGASRAGDVSSYGTAVPLSPGGFHHPSGCAGKPSFLRRSSG